MQTHKVMENWKRNVDGVLSYLEEKKTTIGNYIRWSLETIFPCLLAFFRHHRHRHRLHGKPFWCFVCVLDSLEFLVRSLIAWVTSNFQLRGITKKKTTTFATNFQPTGTLNMCKVKYFVFSWQKCVIDDDEIFSFSRLKSINRKQSWKAKRPNNKNAFCIIFILKPPFVLNLNWSEISAQLKI